MDIISHVLKNYYMVNEEAENMKIKILKCINNNEEIMKGFIHHKIDLSKVYKETEVNHFGHLIAFYSFLEIYKEKK